MVRIMVVMLYISFAADLAAAVMMIWQLFKLKELSGEKEAAKVYFRRFSWIVILMSVLHALKTVADLKQGVVSLTDLDLLTEAEAEVWLWTQMSALFIDVFLSTVFLYLWISFLSWYLYKDKNFIRRKFWMGFMPLIISAVVSLISIPMVVLSKRAVVFFIISAIVAFLIRIFYMLTGLGLLRGYKKQNGYLRFFNPWVFFIPLATSWLLQDLLDWGFGSLGTALGVFIMFISIIREVRYMDPETGFYKMEFVGYLKKLTAKNKYAPLSAMSFTLDSPGEMKEFAGILKKQLPENCEPILRSDCEVVVLTSVGERAPLNMVIRDVEEVCRVKTACTLKKKVTTEEFMESVL